MLFPYTHPLQKLPNVCRWLSQQTPINSTSADGSCLCHLLGKSRHSSTQVSSVLCQDTGIFATERPVGCKSDTSQLLISSIRHAAGKQIRRGITASETERLAARCVQQQGSHGFETRVLIKCLFFVSKRLEICCEYPIQPNRITGNAESPVAIHS